MKALLRETRPSNLYQSAIELAEAQRELERLETGAVRFQATVRNTASELERWQTRIDNGWREGHAELEHAKAAHAQYTAKLKAREKEIDRQSRTVRDLTAKVEAGDAAELESQLQEAQGEAADAEKTLASFQASRDIAARNQANRGLESCRSRVAELEAAVKTVRNVHRMARQLAKKREILPKIEAVLAGIEQAQENLEKAEDRLADLAPELAEAGEQYSFSAARNPFLEHHKASRARDLARIRKELES
jgi:chromosome segregation ATPase